MGIAQKVVLVLTVLAIAVVLLFPTWEQSVDGRPYNVKRAFVFAPPTTIRAVSYQISDRIFGELAAVAVLGLGAWLVTWMLRRPVPPASDRTPEPSPQSPSADA